MQKNLLVFLLSFFLILLSHSLEGGTILAATQTESSSSFTLPIPSPQISLKNSQGKLLSQNSYLLISHLPSDTYTVTFEPLPHWESPDPQTFFLEEGKTKGPFVGTYTLKKELLETKHLPSSLRIHSGNTLSKQNTVPLLLTGKTPTSFTLMNPQTSFSCKGSTDTLLHLTPGEYVVSFTSEDHTLSEAGIPFTLKKNHPLWIEPTALNSTLILTTNLAPCEGKLHFPNRSFETFCSKTTSSSFSLPPGDYLLELSSPTHPGYSPVSPIPFSLEGGKTKRLYCPYPLKESTLVITSNLSHAPYTLWEVLPNTQKLQGRYQGDYTVLSLPQGKYLIEFEDLPLYQTPESPFVTIQDSCPTITGGVYTPLLPRVHVPSGFYPKEEELVFVPSFSLGTYEVTNGEFASWLNQAFDTKNWTFSKQTGEICYQENLLAKIDPKGFLQAAEKEGQLSFFPIPGKENHPVTHVSFYGAQKYCQAVGGRLPKEIEWEKAASLRPSTDNTAIQYIFGCSCDTIDETLANYNQDPDPSELLPVGFFDGIHLLRYSSELAQELKENPSLLRVRYGTKRATSPCGAYDMSGNVREWVEGEKGSVTKGGSYQDSQEALQVLSRTPVDPKTTDPFTGFRVLYLP